MSEETKRPKLILTIKGKYNQDIRCSECGHLLFKARMPLHKSVGIEVKCRKCGHINRF